MGTHRDQVGRGLPRDGEDLVRRLSSVHARVDPHASVPQVLREARQVLLRVHALRLELADEDTWRRFDRRHRLRRHDAQQEHLHVERACDLPEEWQDRLRERRAVERDDGPLIHRR